MGHQLVGFFGCGIQRYRVVYLIICGIRNFFVGSIYGRGGGIYQMLHTGFAVVIRMTAGFQDIVETDHVGLDIGVRVCDGIADASLSTKVYYNCRLVLCENLIDHCFVSKVAFVKLVSGFWMLCCAFLNFRKSPLFDGNIVIVVHVVQSHNVDRGLGSQKLQYQVAADEAGGSCYKNGLIF